jgi:hypothetical protein
MNRGLRDADLRLLLEYFSSRKYGGLDLDGKESIIKGCAEDVMPTLRGRSVDLVFSTANAS